MINENLQKFDEGPLETKITPSKFFYVNHVGLLHLPIPVEATDVLINTIEELNKFLIPEDALVDGREEFEVDLLQEQMSGNYKSDAVENISEPSVPDRQNIVSFEQCSPFSSSSSSDSNNFIPHVSEPVTVGSCDSIQEHSVSSGDESVSDVIPPLEDDNEETAVPASTITDPAINDTEKVYEIPKKKRPIKLAAVFSTQEQPPEHTKSSCNKPTVSFPNFQGSCVGGGNGSVPSTDSLVYHNPLNLVKKLKIPTSESHSSSLSSLDHSLTQQLERVKSKVKKLEQALLEEDFIGLTSLDERLNDVDQAIEFHLKHLMEKSWFEFNQKTTEMNQCKPNKEICSIYLKQMELRMLKAEQQKLQTLCDLYC